MEPTVTSRAHVPSDGDHRYERRAGVGVLTWPLFDGLPVEAVVTGREGGCSTGPYTSLNLGLHVGDDPERVVENRARAARTIGMDLDELVFCRQSHDRTVVRVGASDRGRGTRSGDDAVPDTDALLTTDPRVGLAVMVADCVPIVLVCPESRVLSCVHAGWRGTTRRVVEAAVDAMVALGSRAASIRAALGPAIPAARYQVGADVLAAAEDAFGDRAGELVVADGTGRWRFDLWAANLVVLEQCGVDPLHTAVARVGTGDDGPFFSDRAHRPCGRFATLARLTPEG